MPKIPEAVIDAWNSRKGAVVFVTVDESGLPNAIYATCVNLVDNERIAIADNYFNKTRSNIFSNSKGSILFITKDDVSYQIKGSVEYHIDGSHFDDMKKWNPAKHPGHAAVLVNAEMIYSGSDIIFP